jgi:hypothetical protein
MSIKSIDEFQQKTTNYFDSLNTSGRDIEFYLSDEKNPQLYDQAERLDQIYSLRNKYINKFKKYIRSNQYYFDLYQEIKKLPKDSLKNYCYGEHPLPKNIRLKNRKLLNKISASISDEKKMILSEGKQYELLSATQKDFTKIKITVNNYLIDLFICSCILIIDESISVLTITTRESSDKRKYQKQLLIKLREKFIKNPKESKKDWHTRIKNLFFKNKAYKVSGPYKGMKTPFPLKNVFAYLNNSYSIKEEMIKKDLTSFFLQNFPIEGWHMYKNISIYNYYKTEVASYKPYINNLGEEKYFNGFPFFFSDHPKWPSWSDGNFNNLIDKPLINMLALIKNEYEKDAKDLYTQIQAYCCVLKKNNSINHSIKLCEKLIVDYKNFVSFEISGYEKRTSFFIDQMKLVSLQNYKVGDHPFFNENFFFQQIQDQQVSKSYAYHPLNINIKNGFVDIYKYIIRSLTKSMESSLFDRLSGINNSDSPFDRHGYLKTGFKDWFFRESARGRVSKNYIKKIHNFIQVDKNSKNRQLTFDWMLLELVNFNEENYDDYLDKNSKFEVFGSFNIKHATKALSLVSYKIEHFNDFALAKLHKKLEKLKIKNNIINWHQEVNVDNELLYQSFFTKNCPSNALSQFTLDFLKQKLENDKLLSGVKKAEQLNTLFRKLDVFTDDTLFSKKNLYKSQPYHCHNIKILESIIDKYESAEQPNKDDYDVIQDWLKIESVFHRKDESYFLSNQNKGIDHKFFQFTDMLKNSQDSHKYKIVGIIIDILDLINISPMSADRIQKEINDFLSMMDKKKIERVKDKLLDNAIKGSEEYEISIWLTIDMIISAQKNQISIRLMNRINNNILQALLFIQGIFPFSGGAGIYDPYRKISSQLEESISFFKNVAITMYEENNPRNVVPKKFRAKNPAKLQASLITSEIINSLEGLKNYINIIEMNNIFDLNPKPGNLLTRSDISKEHLAIMARSNENNPIYAKDLKLKKYLKDYNEKYNDRRCNSCQKKINKSNLRCKNCGVKIPKIIKSKTAFIDKLLYSKENKQLIQSKTDKNYIERKSALKWLRERSGKKKLNDLCVSLDFSGDIDIESFVKYSKENSLELKLKKKDDL